MNIVDAKQLKNLQYIQCHDAKWIVLCLVKCLDGQKYFTVAKLRKALGEENVWYDNISEKDEMDALKEACFNLSHTREEWSSGGSWSPEGPYTQHYWKCRMCGEVIKDREQQILRGCHQLGQILCDSDSWDEFFRTVQDERSS